MKVFILEDGVGRNIFFSQKFDEEHFVICNEANMGNTILENTKFDVLFLDHDLGRNIFMSSEEENTGATVCKKLSKTVNVDTPAIIHSWNPAGAEYMKNTLESTGFKGQIIVAPYAGIEFEQVVNDLLGIEDEVQEGTG